MPNAKLQPIEEYPFDVIPIDPPATRTPDEPPYWMQRTFAERRQGDLDNLAEWLDLVKLAELRKLAKERGWTIKGTRKADVIRQMIEQMATPETVQAAIERLDDEHKWALVAITLLGDFESSDESALVEVAEHWGRLKAHRRFSTYASHLWNEGLVLPQDRLGDYAYIRVALVGPGMDRLFPPLLAPHISHSDQLQSDNSASDLRLADAYGLVRTANQLVALLEQQSLPLRTPMPRPKFEQDYRNLAEWDYDPDELPDVIEKLQKRRWANLTLTVPPPQRALPNEVIEQLTPLAGSEERLEFIYALLVESGLLQPGSPVTVWSEVKTAFWRQSELAQRAVLARAYFNLEIWNEIWEVIRSQETLQLKRAWSGYYYVSLESFRAELRGFRLLVLRILALLPDNRWIHLNDLRNLFQRAWPEFNQGFWMPSYYAGRHHKKESRWYLTSDGKTLEGQNEQDWMLAQWSFIQYMLIGPLAWLGFVDLNVQDGIVTDVRFHGLSDTFWHKAEAPAGPRHHVESVIPDEVASPQADDDAVSIEGDLIHVNPAAVSAQTHNLLDRIGELERADAEKFVYRLDGHAVHQSFESGVALNELRHQWNQLLAAPMPRTIEEKLETWWTQYGQVRVYEDVTIIELADDHALAELKSVTDLEKVMIAEISPRLVLIPKTAVQSLSEQLEKAGYMPQIVGV
ncbi:helicase-associated domain-containing protein [Chloroflexi bacterium TSY]|nr:helicase-associated domain-containing protein [Chloroflexi bacterium TSY]